MTPPIRERPSLAVHAARVTRRFFVDNGRGLAIAAVAGVFLALAGAFDTSRAPMQIRFAFWLTAMIGGGVIGGVVADVFRAYGWWEDKPLIQGVVMTPVMSLPLTVFIWLLTGQAFGNPMTPRTLLFSAPAVVLVSAVMVALNYATSRKPPVTHAAPTGAAPPRFLERLPLKLRGADVWAVEAEDHYLRLHTSRGQDLILMRLSDAVAELEGLEGAQTHRSWWVAKDAVTDARRGDGRATLTLKDGAQVPVSRAYAKALREAGWY